jgi:hypothetical protein
VVVNDLRQDLDILVGVLVTVASCEDVEKVVSEGSLAHVMGLSLLPKTTFSFKSRTEALHASYSGKEDILVSLIKGEEAVSATRDWCETAEATIDAIQYP